MYEFRDTIKTEASDAAGLSSEALKINNEYIENLIEGYHTLTVSGREALSPEIDTDSAGIRDGSRMKSRRYPERTITVEYQLIAKSPEDFRAAYTKLAYILDVEDAELIFNDEPDKFFIGTPCSFGEVDPGKISVIGSFDILCTDPFKYSVREYEAEAESVSLTAGDGSTYKGKAFNLYYGGTYRAFPVLIGEFFDNWEYGENATTLTGNGDCGYLAFFNEDGKIIQLGDPEELDTEAVPSSQTLINQSFQYKNSWGADAKKLWSVNSGLGMFYDEVQVGTVGMAESMPNAPDGNYFMTATNFGSSSAVRYGASITRSIPADASGSVGAANFSFSFRHKHCPTDSAAGQNECGVFYALVVNGSGSNRKILAGVRISKYSPNGWYGKTEFFVNGKVVKATEFSFSPRNEYFGVGGKQSSTITKSGNAVSFDIGGMKYSCNCYDSGFAAMEAKEVTFMFARYGSAAPLKYNGVSVAKFVKNNCAAYRDIPNKFSANDIVQANCKTGEVYLNDLPRPDLGALGNEWEQFYLTPGVNQIGASYSNWLTDAYAPKLKMRYREVFL